MIQQFLNRISGQRSANTAKTYGTQINKIFPDGNIIFEPAYIDAKIAEWKHNGDSVNTIKLRLSILCQLMKFCKRHMEIKDFDEIEEIYRNFKGEKKMPEVATKEQVEAVLNVIYDYKYQVIIELMFYCGLRISEAISLNLEDIRDRRLIIRESKNNEARIVTIPKKLLQTINSYIQKERINSDEHALLTTEKGRLDKSVAQKMIKKYSKEAGYPNLHCHAFRHGAATHLLNQGVDTLLIKEFLGHQSIVTTQRYAHVSAKLMDNIADVFDDK